MTNISEKVRPKTAFPFPSNQTDIGNNITFRFKIIFIKDIILWSAGVLMKVMVTKSPKNSKQLSCSLSIAELMVRW